MTEKELSSVLLPINLPQYGCLKSQRFFKVNVRFFYASCYIHSKLIAVTSFTDHPYWESFVFDLQVTAMQYSNLILVLAGKNAVVYQCVKYVNKLIKLNDKYLLNGSLLHFKLILKNGSKYMHQNTVNN